MEDRGFSVEVDFGGDEMKTARTLWLRLRGERRVAYGVENVSGGIKDPRIAAYTAELHRSVALLDKALGNHVFQRSLEIGCGYGRITPWIARHSLEHHAVEPEPKFLKLAEPLYPDVRFHRVLAQSLPFPPRHFDLVVSFSVLTHICPAEVGKAVEELKRVASPEAVVCLHEGVSGRSGFRCRYWIHDYEQLFSPLKITQRFGGDSHRELMVFERGSS